MQSPAPDFDAVLDAHKRIAPWIHRTPVLTSDTFNTQSGATLYFKCENLQKAGAFKARGAHNAVFSLSDADAARGVATHSSGNHGAALACAARSRGIPATVVMPQNAPRAKVAAVRNYGGDVHFCEPNTPAREAMLQTIVEDTGAKFVHPYDNAEVIAGQGTCALELVEDFPDLDAILTPVGGGGLLSGTALTLAARAPGTRLLAAEPRMADDAYRSLQSGQIEPMDNPQTIADGLKTPLGQLTFPLIRDHVESILLVSESQIIDAMRLIWERMKVVVEPSAATVLAAVFAHADTFAGQRVGVIFSGGNVDLDTLPWQSQGVE